MALYPLAAGAASIVVMAPLGTDDLERFAACALQAVRTRFPHKLDHLMLDEHDRPRPADIHPVFDGSYDWHSSVHMHWSLLRLLRRAPALPQRAAIVAHLESRWQPELVAAEREYASQARRGSFERPYGWAWLLALQAELEAPDDTLPERARWAQALRPLADDLADRLAAFLARSDYPVRAGTHANSAFAMRLARRWPEPHLQQAIAAAAQRWFAADRDYPARYEPGGADFLSGGLEEAALMLDLLGADFPAWWQGFAPRADLAAWLHPVRVSDRLDPQLVHLDGLNLSRAGCLEAISRALGEARFSEAAAQHRAATWPHVTAGDFGATHWLVSFALLACGD